MESVSWFYSKIKKSRFSLVIGGGNKRVYTLERLLQILNGNILVDIK